MKAINNLLALIAVVIMSAVTICAAIISATLLGINVPFKKLLDICNLALKELGEYMGVKQGANNK